MLTPEGTFKFCYGFKAKLPPDAKPDDKPKFSARLGFTAEQQSSPAYKALVAEVLRVARAEWKEDADKMIQEGQIKLPFRKDVTGKGFADDVVVFIGASTGEDSPPGVVLRDGKTAAKPADVYPGSRGRLDVTVAAYSHKGNKGVTFYFNHAQKLGDGPRLDNKKSAADTFGGDNAAPDEPAGDLASMVG